MESKFNRVLDGEIYSRKAVAEARNAFKGYCLIKATPMEEGRVSLIFKVHESYESKAREVILGFLNYALDRSVQVYLEETK